MQKNFPLLLSVSSLLLAKTVLAANISLSMQAEKEVPITIQGEVISVLKPVRTVRVGDTLVMTLHYKNNDYQEAYAVNIDNPIPFGTRFVSGSGSGKGAIFYVSYDNGQSYEEDIRLQNTPVTHIRWYFEHLAAQAEGEVSFSLVIEKADHRLMP